MHELTLEVIVFILLHSNRNCSSFEVLIQCNRIESRVIIPNWVSEILNLRIKTIYLSDFVPQEPFQTLAIFILIYFMTLKNPPANLVKVVKFIIMIYASIWFGLKCNSNCTNAPRIMFKALKLIKSLPLNDQAIALPISEIGNHWAHMENLLLIMAADPDRSIREKAVSKFLKIRAKPFIQKKPHHGKSLNKIVTIKNVPKPLYDAVSYDEMIDMQKEDPFEPPYTRNLSDQEIKQLVDSPLIVPVPHHMQHVERAIRVITEHVKYVASSQKREGTFKDRKERLRCETKANFS
jgi:hypothetical protein